MKFEVISSTIGDNYFYLVANESGAAALIDPIDAAAAVARVRDLGLELQVLVNTHFHWDHVNGNGEVLKAFPDAELVAGPVDAARIDEQMRDQGVRTVQRHIRGGESLEVGSLSLQVLDTPGHTPGHISLLVDDHLLSGDTIFVGGAGNCSFGGDPGQLFRTFRDVLRGLDDSVCFYPGHDYSVRNLEFVLSIEPEQQEASAALEDARQAHAQGRLFVTSMRRERLFNPFLRYDDPVLRRCLETSHQEILNAARAVSETDHEAVFRCLRELRNNW